MTKEQCTCFKDFFSENRWHFIFLLQTKMPFQQFSLLTAKIEYNIKKTEQYMTLGIYSNRLSKEPNSLQIDLVFMHEIQLQHVSLPK